MVIRIEVSDEKAEHVELTEAGELKLFSTTAAVNDGYVLVSERQTGILRAIFEAERNLKASTR